MTIRVYIATTQGPVEIQRITEEDEALHSVVCLNGTAKSLPISRSYESFVREPTGVIQRAYGHGAYRMDVAEAITDGNSWQLGTLIAHALRTEKLLNTQGQNPDIVVWATGEVDRDLVIRPVEHIREKLNASKKLFETLRKEGIPVYCFVPSGVDQIPDDDFLEEIGVDGENLQLEGAPDISHIARRLNITDPTPEDDFSDDNEEGDIIDVYAPQEGEAPPLKDYKIAKLLVLAGAIFALVLGVYLQFEDNIQAMRANSLQLGLKELRAHPDLGCQNPQVFPLKREGEHFPHSRLEGLCAVEITLTNLGAPAYLWVFAQRLSDGHYLLADRESLLKATTQQGQIGWRMTVPTGLSRTLDYRIVALASRNPLQEPVNRMLRQTFGDENPDWSKTRANLEEEGITVISLIHSLVKQVQP